MGTDEQPKVQQVDYFGQATGLDKLGAAEAGEAPANPNATPDAPTWLGRRKQDISGRQDPRYKDTATVFEQFTDELTSPTATAAVMGASDKQMGDVIAKQLGNRLIRRERDAN